MHPRGGRSKRDGRDRGGHRCDTGWEQRLTDQRVHSSITVFPGIDRASLFNKKNVHELFAELAWSFLTLPLLIRWLPWRMSGRDAR